MVGSIWLNKWIFRGLYGVCLAGMAVSAFAELDVKHVMVDSQVMRLPKISLDGINYKALAFEYGTKGDVDIISVGEAVERVACGESNYLKVEYSGPSIVFRIYDASRKKVLLRKAITTDGAIEYGRGQCSSLGDVKAEFSESRAPWLKSLKKSILSGARKDMQRFIHDDTALTYEDIRFPLFFISANGSQFNDINQAFDRARRAFDLYMQFGVTIDATATLAEVTVDWEKALHQLQKGSGRNGETDAVRLVLHRNLSITYLFLANFHQARRHDALANHHGMPASETIQPLVLKHEKRYILSPAVAKNLVLMSNLYRFGTNVIKEAVLVESDIKKLAVD